VLKIKLLQITCKILFSWTKKSVTQLWVTGTMNLHKTSDIRPDLDDVANNI